MWCLQIPLPSVPPLVLAILPISSSFKAVDLSKYQIQLMRGLISRGFRIVSGASDGAAVERDCQRRTASVGTLVEFRIRHPDPTMPDIVIPLHDLDGNIWVIIQDSKHALKTTRNNEYSGARLLVLGNFVVNYEQVYIIAINPKGPLYRRDVIKYDKQDDNAAIRLFSAATLLEACKDTTNNLGFAVYLFVFGEFIDAYQSRTMPHKQRAIIAIRTLLFMETWRSFLRKNNYSYNHHFISHAAYDIFKILAHGLLGLIVIHRDHLKTPCPLLPWQHGSEGNEQSFSSFRSVAPDFSMQQAVLITPKARTLAEASFHNNHEKVGYKKTANGYQHTYFRADGADFDLLSQYPTDMDLSDAYATAVEENDSLWTLLGIHPQAIDSAPMPSLLPQLVSDSETGGYALEDDSEEQEIPAQSDAEKLQSVIDGIASATNLSAAEDNQLDALTYASVALTLQELAKM